jgi:hypothetical protein
MRSLLIVVFLVITFVSNTEAQRIRYKNLFPILQSKDYKTAEPQLLKFLEENDDEANAYFYLGEIIVSKLDTVEIFPSLEKYDSMANQAIKSYKKAISLVDDREVRKNDDYYMAYNRRDLRTGKFGIKTSDVHLDYENKISSVSSKKELILELHHLKEGSKNQYDNFKNKIVGFYSSYPDEIAFLLRANPEDRETLNQSIKFFNDFKEQYSLFVDKLNSLNHPLYDPELKILPISNWDQLAPKDLDFSDFKIEIQDYDEYLTSVNNRIESEVRPLEELLYETDNDFNEALKTNESVKDSAEIQELNIPQELKNGLSSLDESNVIYNLLQYKQLKNKSNLLTNVSLMPVLADSSNIYQRANIVDQYKNRLGDQLELIKLVDSGLDDHLKANFAMYFDGFEPSIDAYINTEKTILEKKYKSVAEKSREMAIDIQYFLMDKDTVYTTPLNAAANDGHKYTLDLIESDTSLFIVGNWENKPFVARAGFDMIIENIKIIEDTTFKINKILELKGNILVNIKSKQDKNPSQVLLYLSYLMEEVWRLEFSSENTLGDAKVEAGIFFLYDQDGNVLKTLNAKGQEIGN